MPIRSQVNLIIGKIAFEFGKIAEYDFVYILSSTNINQSATNLVTMYMSIRFQMSFIMGQFILEQCYPSL